MDRTEIRTALEKGKPGDEVTIAGWVKSLRQSKTVAFLHLNDGSTFDSIQVLVGDGLANKDAVLKLITGASLSVKGRLVASPAKGQTVELEPTSIEILGDC